MKLIIGDVHGTYKTLMALLEKAKGIQPILVGDLVDRGPMSAQVVQWAMENNIPTVKGNHEDMMIRGSKDTEMRGFGFNDDRNLWLTNGGVQTIKSYGMGVTTPLEEFTDQYKNHLAWLDNLPSYLEFKDELDDKGRSLFVSHAGLPYKDIEKAVSTKDIMWHRNYQYVPENVFSIFGHTPQKEPMVRSNYANVDTGCCFTRKFWDGTPSNTYGKLTAIVWPTLEIIQQKNIDDDSWSSL